MNNRFQEFADEFVDENYAANDDERFSDVELESRILAFVATKNVDPVWEDELVELIRDYFQEMS